MSFLDGLKKNFEKAGAKVAQQAKSTQKLVKQAPKQAPAKVQRTGITLYVCFRQTAGLCTN